MSSARRTILVAGALGVVGRAVVERFAARADATVIALARRASDFAPQATWISVDLRDAAATRAALAAHPDVTHLVYAALHEQADLLEGWRAQANVDLNTAMLRHTLDALAGAPLAHVTLLQGTKAYGVHTGRAMRVPARETDAVRDHANFYFDQQDLVAARGAATGFDWTIFRPQIVLGVAVGSAMNPVATLAAYALLARERGLPLVYPGPIDLLTECTDARLIAQAIEWAWDAPRAHGEAFNIANGDVVVWAELFKRLADHFDMPLGQGPPRRHAARRAGAPAAARRHAGAGRVVEDPGRARRSTRGRPGRPDRAVLAICRSDLGGLAAARRAAAGLDHQAAPGRLRRLHRLRGMHRRTPGGDERARLPARAPGPAGHSARMSSRLMSPAHSRLCSRVVRSSSAGVPDLASLPTLRIAST
jgi:nucleoside-diphosphate-sugar epimerase